MRAVPWAVGCLASVALVACGGEPTAGTDPNTWTSGFCSLIDEWASTRGRSFRNVQTQLQSAPSEFTTATGELDSRRVRQLSVRAASATVRLDENMLAKYEALGTPAVEEGAVIRREIRAAFVGATQVPMDVLERARTLPVDTPKHFLEALKGLSSAFAKSQEEAAREMSTLFGSRFSNATELGQAARDEPACQRLRTYR
jgi:hypothetical protein